MKLGKAVKQRREIVGITQAELADRAGCSPWTVIRLETREQTPRVPTMLAIADALGVSMDWLTAAARAQQPPPAPELLPEPLPFQAHA